jgi:hypothetical protein
MTLKLLFRSIKIKGQGICKSLTMTIVIHKADPIKIEDIDALEWVEK